MQNMRVSDKDREREKKQNEESESESGRVSELTRQKGPNRLEKKTFQI